MANWANPLITTQYDVFVAEMKDRDVDTATMFSSASTGTPVGSVRFNRSTKIFEEWNGSVWVALVLGLTGGGTGAASGSGAAGNLGLGTMAYQNSNNVYITGGSILDPVVTRFGGQVYPWPDNTYDCGLSNARWRNGWFATGMVIPVGVDRYVVG